MGNIRKASGAGRLEWDMVDCQSKSTGAPDWPAVPTQRQPWIEKQFFGYIFIFKKGTPTSLFNDSPAL